MAETATRPGDTTSPRKHDVPDERLSRLLAKYQKPEDLIGESGLLKQLTKLLVERALDAEMTEHHGHEKHEPAANEPPRQHSRAWPECAR